MFLKNKYYFQILKRGTVKNRNGIGKNGTGTGTGRSGTETVCSGNGQLWERYKNERTSVLFIKKTINPLTI